MTRVKVVKEFKINGVKKNVSRTIDGSKAKAFKKAGWKVDEVKEAKAQGAA